MKKEERLAKKQREDQALNRVLWWFGGAVVLEFFLLLLNRFYVNFDAAGVALARGLFQALQVLAWVSLALTAAAVIWWALARKKGGRTFLPGVLALIFTVVLVCSFSLGMWKDLGLQFLYVCVPVVAVLALVYYLYQREFFLVAIQGGVALFAMWSYRKLADINLSAVRGIFGVVALVTLVGTALFIVLQRGRGCLGKVRLLPRKTNYLPMYLGAGVTAVALLMALLLGATAAYIAIFGVVAWLFGVAVYYTVRLM